VLQDLNDAVEMVAILEVATENRIAPAVVGLDLRNLDPKAFAVGVAGVAAAGAEMKLVCCRLEAILPALCLQAFEQTVGVLGADLDDTEVLVASGVAWIPTAQNVPAETKAPL
jgi:hypothetical protein